jgi:hypothetical protein
MNKQKQRAVEPTDPTRQDRLGVFGWSGRIRGGEMEMEKTESCDGRMDDAMVVGES